MTKYFEYPIYCECRGLWHIYDIQRNEKPTVCYGNLDDVKFLIKYAIAWDIPIEIAYETLGKYNDGCWYNENIFKQRLKKLKEKLKKENSNET